MKLFYRSIGSNLNPTLIIAHGLYGCSDNWISIAKQLEDQYHIILVDMRNHGKSPHALTMTYDEMVDDLKELIDDLNLNKVSLLGHSMGGKTAMLFAINYPELIDKLIIVDIAPKAYSKNNNIVSAEHKKIITSLLEVKPSDFSNRKDIDNFLSNSIPNPAIRNFLLKNIIRTKDNKLKWQIDFNILYNNLPNIMGDVDTSNNQYPESKRVLFIRGANSPYIQADDIPKINNIFPFASICNIENATHWVHAEKPQIFIKRVKCFLENQ